MRVTFLSDDGRVAEEGVDQGGVSREFFQLLVAQLFSPDYGMFVEVEESNSMWFNTASLESLVSVAVCAWHSNRHMSRGARVLPAAAYFSALATSFVQIILIVSLLEGT